MKRRTFILTTALSAASTFLSRCAREVEKLEEKFTIQKSNFWTGDYFHQNNVDASKTEEGIIRARIDSRWESYPLCELDEGYISWSISDRIDNLKTMRGGNMPDWSGAHNAAVATCGKNRGDSRFDLNNAIKGTGYCPKSETVEGLIKKLKETQEKPHSEKFDILEQIYQDRSLWDYRKLISLELYATPDFETHSFLNQMENPLSTIVYLDIPSYELRTIVQLLHPKDPNLTPTESLYVEYINTIHTYMHTHFTAVVPASIYHIVEEFDNSPSGRGGKGMRGLRVM